MTVLSTVLAGMGGNGNNDHMDASDWAWMSLIWLVALAVIALVVWLVIRATHHPAGGTRSARDILSERYAKGEIDHDEYEERLSRLR